MKKLYMSNYCNKDVLILEEVYLRLRPYIKGHPNIGNFIESTVPTCATCGSSTVEEIKGRYYVTPAGKYKLYRCKECGAISRGRINLNKKVNTLSVCY